MEIPQKVPWDGELVPGILEAQILDPGRCFILNFRMKAGFHPSHTFHRNNWIEFILVMFSTMHLILIHIGPIKY